MKNANRGSLLRRKKNKKRNKKKEVCQYLRRCKENMKFLMIKNDDENMGLAR